MKKRSLRYKLTVSYAFIALLLVACVSVIANLFMRSQFEQYMIRQQEAKNQEIAAQISQQMAQNTADKSRARALETVGVSALERGVIVKVYDTSGNILWNAMEHNGGFCHQMLKDMAAQMQSRSPNFKGQYEEKNYTLFSGVKKLGTAAIGYYGPFYYSSSDAEFINTLNKVLFWVGIGSLLVAILLGFYMANRVSSPIARVIGTAENIAKGNYKDKISSVSSTKELDSLTASINRLSDKLQNQEALRKRLTSDIAHELRTPLAALQGNMEALIDGVWEPSRERFESCNEEILRLSRLVSELGRLTQLEDENSELIFLDVDLKELAEKAVNSFQAEALKKRIDMSIAGADVVIQADPDKISRIFVNLLSNALKYTPDGGNITVQLKREANNAAIEIADTGTGINAKDLPYIFERFYRTDLSRSSRSGGAGIGLTIVKAIVELHHGRISVQSEVGKGTAFRVVLPLKQKGNDVL